MYNFDNAKSKILDFVKSNKSFGTCYVVRNIFSRFAIYAVGAENIESFSKEAMSKFGEWIDTVKSISESQDKFICYDLAQSSELVEGTTNVFFSERHIDNTNWFIQDDTKVLNTPVTSFYSFKGGVGRTTAAILTALQLAREGKKVVLIDFDLEAPGLASVFAKNNESSEKLLSVKGFIDFLIDYEASSKKMEKIKIDDYYFVVTDSVLVGKKGGELVVVPAIATDSDSAETYIEKLSKVDMKYTFGKNYTPDIFLKIIEEVIKPDFMLIDVRTGINNIGGLVFNRYAQNVFLFFYGNQQNLFGLESILPKLIKLSNKDVKFYLVNSPVPKNETDREAEINFYIDKSYSIFFKNSADYQSNPPSIFDETADHYPINIPFNDQALLLNSYKRIAALIDSFENPYRTLSDIVLRSHPHNRTEDKIENGISNQEFLDYIVKIDIGAGTSEVEYRKQEDLKKYFYPRKDYKYIFDKDKFLILGEKGVGKTALFSVLSHNAYAKSLAQFCGVNTNEIERNEWIIGLEKDAPDFPSKENFNSLKKFTIQQMRNYWLTLLLRNSKIREVLPNDSVIKQIEKLTLMELNNFAKKEGIGERLYDTIEKINNKLRNEDKNYVVVYDHLDAVLEHEVRGKLVSSLLTFYYDNLNRYSNIKAKIFLRKDIFDREVNDITDKVKIQNNSVEIKWEYNQLLNVIWKRIYEQKRDLYIFDKYKELLFDDNEVLGSVPKLSDEQDHKAILDEIFGKNMGGNNKTYPYNWIKTHIEDTNNQIHPRTLIKLFSESAKLQQEDKDEPKDRIIRSKNIQNALSDKVSKHQVQELGEEYPELKPIFDRLSEITGGRSPMSEETLTKAIRRLAPNTNVKNTISNLKEIGLLKDYKVYAKTRGEENEGKRYHIPDLYLFGLNFTRKGTR